VPSRTVKDMPQNQVDLRKAPLEAGSYEKVCKREGAGAGASVAHGGVPGDDCHGRCLGRMMRLSESIGKCSPGGSLPRGQGRRRLGPGPTPSAPGSRVPRGASVSIRTSQPRPSRQQEE